MEGDGSQVQDSLGSTWDPVAKCKTNHLEKEISNGSMWEAEAGGFLHRGGKKKKKGGEENGTASLAGLRA